MNSLRPTYADVDLAALRRNVFWLREKAGQGTWFCPMVKANAYGHGAVAVARVLEEMKVDALGVAMVEEGLALRQAGIRLPILVFGLFFESAAELCFAQGLTPVLSRWSDLAEFEKKASGHFPVHVKINTGMNRLGFEFSEISKLSQHFRQSKNLKLEGLCSHLIRGEDWSVARGTSAQQAEALKTAARAFAQPVPMHLLNSAALLSESGTLGFGVRPGIAIYGAGFQKEPHLQPVMHLRSEVAMVHSVRKNEGVSYDSRWRAQRDSLVATVPIGYGDGFSRILTNRIEALIQEQRVPLVGTVCMDYIMLDVTKVVERFGVAVKQGDPVTLWGKQGAALISVDEIAERAETISYELLTNVGPRISRRYRDGD